MSYRKHLMTSDEPPSELYKAAEVGTNLAEVGTDCISRQQAIDALNEYFARIGKLKRRGLTKGEKAISLDTVGTIKTLPSAQPEPEHTMEEFMYGQDLGSPEDGGL